MMLVLIFLHQWNFNSLDLCYMGRLLDDAAGGTGGAVLPLRQVGQGHGGVDLLPVCLVFALHLLLLRSSDATDTADDHANTHMEDQNRESVRGHVMKCEGFVVTKRKSTYLSHLLDPWSVVSESTRRENKVKFAELFGVNEDLFESQW